MYKTIAVHLRIWATLLYLSLNVRDLLLATGPKIQVFSYLLNLRRKLMTFFFSGSVALL
jgi:hypothetical protein